MIEPKYNPGCKVKALSGGPDMMVIKQEGVTLVSGGHDADTLCIWYEPTVGDYMTRSFPHYILEEVVTAPTTDDIREDLGDSVADLGLDGMTKVLDDVLNAVVESRRAGDSQIYQGLKVPDKAEARDKMAKALALAFDNWACAQ